MLPVLSTAQDYALGRWFIINDTVMGGVSTSQVGWQDNQLVFSGELSLRNNGGFASTRAVIEPRFDKDIHRVQLTVTGDGRAYQLRFRTNRGFDGVAYSVSFETVKDKTLTFSFAEEEFAALYRGYRVTNAPKFSFDDIQQMGFMIADKMEGPFQLKVAAVDFN